MEIKKEVLELEEELIALRRWFHQNPEPGYQEYETSSYIKRYLQELGLVCTTVAKTGVCAVLQGSNAGGKTVLLRADMDALPVEEATGHSYASAKKGWMHACGHDGHIAIQLIVAKILCRHKEELNGAVKFIFQPNEEEAGALDMIQEGILETPKVDVAFALHLWSPVSSGRVGLSAGPVLGTTEEFELVIKGKSGHTAMPQTARDALLGACDIVSSMQSSIGRCFDPLWPIAVVFGSIHGGSARNIITDTVKLGGTIRFLFPDESVNKPKVLQAFERVIQGVCLIHELEYDVRYIPSNPALINDGTLSALVKKNVEAVYECKDNIDEFFSLAGEDFAEISQRVPSVMTFIGIYNEEKNSIFPHHHARFDIDEAMLKLGAELQIRNVLEYLNAAQ